MVTKTCLKPDVPYLIVGGFKGLCASLAIYMAREGARHLVIMARSGYADDLSQATIMHLSALGCRVDLVQGDVTVMEDVERAVKAPGKPLAGVIMGAMVLKVCSNYPRNLVTDEKLTMLQGWHVRCDNGRQLPRPH